MDKFLAPRDGAQRALPPPPSSAAVQATSPSTSTLSTSVSAVSAVSEPPPPLVYGFQDSVVGYPRSVRVAVSHLVVHASSARTERNFSWAGIVATARRNRLSPQALGWLVSLKRNARFLPTHEQMATEYLRR